MSPTEYEPGRQQRLVTMPARHPSCPYNGLPAQAYWRRSVAPNIREGIDPVLHPKFQINGNSKIATAGSCFAQHISRTLQRTGFNYLITEPGHRGLSPAVKSAHNYGVFSARYGNIYTVRQLLQLIQRAFDDLQPKEPWWRDGSSFIDPFRPAIQPKGFASLKEAELDRAAHLAAVRTLFETLDVFIFTLGLTESWICKEDGLVLPVAPGCAGGIFSDDSYAFHNFNVDEVRQDLDSVILRLREINPRASILLTVSPVPLIATFEKRHVLVSTAYSKAVLRTAAQAAYDKYDHVDYFPSYEIVTTHAHVAPMFMPDMREVTPEGVQQVMNVFCKRYLGVSGSEGSVAVTAADADRGRRDGSGAQPPANIADLVCEELFMAEGT